MYNGLWYMIYFLTAIGLTPGGSSTVHIYTQTIHRTTQLTNWEECGPYPIFVSYTLTFALQLRKKHGKTSIRVAEEYQLARWKQNIQNRAYITIRIHYERIVLVLQISYKQLKMLTLHYITLHYILTPAQNKLGLMQECAKNLPVDPIY